jgi:hypothetical protein
MRTRRSRRNEVIMSTVARFLRWAEVVDIRIVALAPILGALMLMGVLLSLGEKLFGADVPEDYFGMVGALSLAVASLSGILQVWRRESPGPLGGSIRGVIAVISGWILAAVCWAAAIMSLWFGFCY